MRQNKSTVILSNDNRYENKRGCFYKSVTWVFVSLLITFYFTFWFCPLCELKVKIVFFLYYLIIPLFYYVIALLFFCFITLLPYYSFVLLRYCLIIPLFCCIIVLLLMTLMIYFFYFTFLLFYYFNFILSCSFCLIFWTLELNKHSFQ